MLVLAHSNRCAGRGRGFQRPQYNWSRFEELIEKSKQKKQGGRIIRMDWFDFKERMEKKDIPLETIEAKWQKYVHAACDDEKDMLGENPDFPERVDILAEEFKEFSTGQRHVHRHVRGSADGDGPEPTAVDWAQQASDALKDRELDFLGSGGRPRGDLKDLLDRLGVDPTQKGHPSP